MVVQFRPDIACPIGFAKGDGVEVHPFCVSIFFSVNEREERVPHSALVLQATGRSRGARNLEFCKLERHRCRLARLDVPARVLRVSGLSDCSSVVSNEGEERRAMRAQLNA